MSYNNIGLVWYNKGYENKAIKYFKKAVIISEKTLPWDHPNRLLFSGNLKEIRGY